MKYGKLVAPIIITVLLVLFLLGYLAAFTIIGTSLVVKIVGVVIIGSLIGVSVFVLVERIKEVRSGDEDDLSQY